jgi:hypothetical protein
LVRDTLKKNRTATGQGFSGFRAVALAVLIEL